MVKYILASGSPRRRELLEQVGLEFEIKVAKGEEITTKINPWEIVEELSAQKASEVAEGLIAEKGSDKIMVIAADTIVAHDKEIMGKPKDRSDAERMIRQLQNNVHQVYTGVTITEIVDGKIIKTTTFNEKTEVYLYPMDETQINEYLETKAGLGSTDYVWSGKAGAYGIQDVFGKKHIKGISGDYYNVVGLPVARLLHELNI